MKVKPKEPRIGESAVNNPARRVKAQHIKYDEKGRELMDPTPIAPPIGYKKSPSITEQIRTMIQSERLRQEAEAQGYESFEEADDFDTGDDFDPKSPYEEIFEPMPQDDGMERLRTLGDHIGDRIFSKLGGEQPSPPEAAPAETSPQPPGSGRREPPKSSPPSAPASDAARTKAEGLLKPRAT